MTLRQVQGAIMIFAALVEIFLGVKAEGQSLESVATPLTAVDDAPGAPAAGRA